MTFEPRLTAHVEVSGLLRRVQAAGGFATVLKKGERDAGTILVVITKNDLNSKIYERMPQLDGSRPWTEVMHQTTDNKREFLSYLDRRAAQDPDLWIVELDIADGERFIETNDKMS